MLGGINLYQYTPNALTWIDPWGLACTVKRGSDVTPDIIKKSLKNDKMMTKQASVSLPAIQRYVDKLINGHTPPPIKIDGNIIIDGNHRYIAGKVLGKKPSTTPGTLSESDRSRVKPMSEILIDTVDWGNY